MRLPAADGVGDCSQATINGAGDLLPAFLVDAEQIFVPAPVAALAFVGAVQVLADLPEHLVVPLGVDPLIPGHVRRVAASVRLTPLVVAR